MTREPETMFEGPCAYATRDNPAGPFVVVVYSSSGVQHVEAGRTDNIDRAKRTCDALNAYPRKSREFHGLL